MLIYVITLELSIYRQVRALLHSCIISYTYSIRDQRQRTLYVYYHFMCASIRVLSENQQHFSIRNSKYSINYCLKITNSTFRIDQINDQQNQEKRMSQASRVSMLFGRTRQMLTRNKSTFVYNADKTFAQRWVEKQTHKQQQLQKFWSVIRLLD